MRRITGVINRRGRIEKGKILEEAVGTTGLNRDHLAHVALLTRNWEDHGRPWGKLPALLIRDIIDFR
ncbi:MAG: hypothetical protein LBL70_08190 [Treponema sp.]|nr:hypothetical protein [Treponema sp.]